MKLCQIDTVFFLPEIQKNIQSEIQKLYQFCTEFVPTDSMLAIYSL